MLPARRFRFWLGTAELTFVLLLGTCHVGAQASSVGAPAAPAAPAPNQTAARPASLDPTTAAPAAGSIESDPDESRLLVHDEPLAKPPESTRWLLLGVGAGTTALWWAGAVGIGELWPGADHRTQLRIPVAGPFIDLGHTGCPAAEPGCSTFQLVLRTILVSLDAIGQAGGIALMLEGATLSTASVEAPRSNQSARRIHATKAPAAVPMPWLDGKGAAGIGLIGQF